MRLPTACQSRPGGVICRRLLGRTVNALSVVEHAFLAATLVTLQLHFTSSTYPDELARMLFMLTAATRREEYPAMASLLSQPWLTLLVPLLLVLIACPLGIIDVNAEHIVTFSQLARRLPRRRRDRPASVSTIHRWRSLGVRGVRLEAVRVGGAWVTSLEAYQRFCDALTNKCDERAPDGRGENRPDNDQTERQLDDLGI